ncbi:DUF6507 family protein [Streptomyces sp. RPT161]|uniref:DUF6507 family protein n=1 Tax=Streptomyces sp. RPT161 TaxID=3015993 RepID=UPI0022B8E0BC|nr:DUF6507 family protein [Streptomyces sp. RPT161]
MSHGDGKWDIDPAGVNSIVTKTAQAAKGMEGDAKSYAKHLEGAAHAAGTLTGEGIDGVGLVGVALGQFAQSTEASLKYLFQRSGASLQGAVDATKDYLNGDLDMAAEAQKNAVQKYPSLPPYVPPQQDKQ